MKIKILFILFFLSTACSLNNYNLLSKKNLFEHDLGENYERGTFLIILANSDLYSRLQYSISSYNFNFMRSFTFVPSGILSIFTLRLFWWKVGCCMAETYNLLSLIKFTGS